MKNIIKKQFKILLSENSDDLKYLAKLSLNNKLFIVGWNLVTYLKMIVINKDINYIQLAVAFHDEIPIGIALSLDYNSEVNLQFFVKENYRRNGIGTILLETIKILPKRYVGNIGEPQSEMFYKKNNITYYNEEGILIEQRAAMQSLSFT